jgi:hypothetical protein
MEIKKVCRLEDSEETIKVLFEHNGQKAEFTYTLIGRDIGIFECSYVEKPDEDIYDIIHAWVKEHITAETKVLFDGKVVEYGE